MNWVEVEFKCKECNCSGELCVPEEDINDLFCPKCGEFIDVILLDRIQAEDEYDEAVQ